MSVEDLPEEDRAQIRAALLQWRAEGAEHPLIPMDVDLNGDGIADAYGLDGNDELVLVSGVSLDLTVYESTGEGGDN